MTKNHDFRTQLDRIGFRKVISLINDKFHFGNRVPLNNENVFDDEVIDDHEKLKEWKSSIFLLPFWESLAWMLYV